jgi:hypothetical protein
LARICSTVPATGEGISVSTLSVEISSSGSSTSTESPTRLSQRVTVPSVTDSPMAGMVTVVPSPAGPSGAGDAAGAAASGGGAASASGADAAGDAGAAAGSAWAAAGSAWAAAGSAEPELALPSPASPMTASSAPTAAVSSSCTTIRTSVPDAGAGISVSTLSVDTSSNGSSSVTWSPSALSQRVTVPSVTLSPRAGILTE